MIFTHEQFAETLFSELALAQSSRLFVAFSGGIDSTVLLHLLHNIRLQSAIEVIALHVNHNLQPESSVWAEHCGQVCESWNIPIRQTTLQLKDNSENTAREARYQWLIEQLDADSFLLTGHHRQDRVETLLFNLMRGAGSKGLSSLRAAQELNGVSLVRPMLHLSGEQIRQYAQAHDLPWIEDPSNQQPHYARNRIRHNVLPVLASFRPDAIQNIARAADNLEQENALLNEIAEVDLANITQSEKNLLDGSYGLSVADLQRLSERRQANCLRKWFAQLSFHTPTRRFMLQMLDAIGSPPPSSAILQESGLQVRFYRDVVYAMPANFVPGLQTPIEWLNIDKGLALFSAAMHIAATAKLKSLVQEQPNARLTLLNREQIVHPRALGGHSLDIKKWLQDSAVPSWRRSVVPILCLRHKDYDLLITAIDQIDRNQWLAIQA